MIAFPGMLIRPAKDAGMKVPDDPDDFDKGAYPHFYVYMQAQLGAPMPFPDAPFENAKVIAAIPDEEITKITYQELLEKGFAEGDSSIHA